MTAEPDSRSPSTEPPSYTPRQLDILAAATRVFSEHGYRAGTIALVASEAGLSQAGLIHHFPNKDAILTAVIELREREDLDVLVPAFQRGEMVVDAFLNVLRKNARRPELMRLFAVLSNEALNPDHPAHGFFVARYARLLAEVTHGTVLNQASGLMRTDVDAEEIARLIIAAADGFRYQSLLADGSIEHWRNLLPLRMMLAGPAAGELPEWARS